MSMQVRSSREPRIGTPEGLEVDATALRVICEGARARGMADALELLSIPAVFLDSTGMVLHAGRSVASALEGVASVLHRHLVGDSVEANQSLGRLIASALAGQVGEESLVVEQGVLDLRALPFGDIECSPAQLVKVVLTMKRT